MGPFLDILTDLSLCDLYAELLEEVDFRKLTRISQHSKVKIVHPERDYGTERTDCCHAWK